MSDSSASVDSGEQAPSARQSVDVHSLTTPSIGPTHQSADDASQTSFIMPNLHEEASSPSSSPSPSSTSSSPPPADYDDPELAAKRTSASLRLLQTWEAVAEKYRGVALEDDDEIDLFTGELVKDRGRLRAMAEMGTGIFGGEDDAGTDAETEGETDVGEDDHDVRQAGNDPSYPWARRKRQSSLTPFLHNILQRASAPSALDFLDQQDLDEFLAEEDARRRAEEESSSSGSSAYSSSYGGDDKQDTEGEEDGDGPVDNEEAEQLEQGDESDDVLDFLADEPTCNNAVVQSQTSPLVNPTSSTASTLPTSTSSSSRPPAEYLPPSHLLHPKLKRSIRFASSNQYNDSPQNRLSQPRHRTTARTSLKALISRDYVDSREQSTGSAGDPGEVEGRDGSGKKRKRPASEQEQVFVKLEEDEDDTPILRPRPARQRRRVVSPNSSPHQQTDTSIDPLTRSPFLSSASTTRVLSPPRAKAGRFSNLRHSPPPAFIYAPTSAPPPPESWPKPKGGKRAPLAAKWKRTADLVYQPTWQRKAREEKERDMASSDGDEEGTQKTVAKPRPLPHWKSWTRKMGIRGPRQGEREEWPGEERWNRNLWGLRADLESSGLVKGVERMARLFVLALETRRLVDDGMEGTREEGGSVAAGEASERIAKEEDAKDGGLSVDSLALIPPEHAVHLLTKPGSPPASASPLPRVAGPHHDPPRLTPYSSVDTNISNFFSLPSPPSPTLSEPFVPLPLPPCSNCLLRSRPAPLAAVCLGRIFGSPSCTYADGHTSFPFEEQAPRRRRRKQRPKKPAKKFGRDENMIYKDAKAFERLLDGTSLNPLPQADSRDVSELPLSAGVYGGPISMDVEEEPAGFDSTGDRETRGMDQPAYERWEPYGILNPLPSAVYGSRL
jgi:hypothetical protein